MFSRFDVFYLCIFRLHRMHEMLIIVTDVCGVCLSVSLSVTLLKSVVCAVYAVCCACGVIRCSLHQMLLAFFSLFMFVLLSIPVQLIGWKNRLQNDQVYVEWDIKLYSYLLSYLLTYLHNGDIDTGGEQQELWADDTRWRFAGSSWQYASRNHRPIKHSR